MDDDKTLAETPAALEPGSAPAAAPSAPAAAPSAPSMAPGSPTSASITASVVMHTEEVTRARVFYQVTAILAAASGAFMPFVRGPLVPRLTVMALCGCAAAIGAYGFRSARDERLYTPRLITIIGVVYGLVGEAVLFYFGMFTAGAMVLPLGVYFYGLSENATAARTTYWFGAALFLFLSGGIVAGVLPDMGPLPVRALPLGWRLFFVVMCQLVFAATFLMARSSRRATQTALERVERAARQIQQRDALLAEARGELERVQRPGEGRYTGQTVDGYKLGEVVGRGGMGEVYRAERETDGAQVAVKLLHPTVLNDPEAIQRFVREVEIAQRVSSPYVARVVKSGLSPSGLPYVAMELIIGHDLAWHLRKATKLPLKKVGELVDHACRALVAIREAGIVHRDLKPHNLILCETEPKVWKVLDFGVSRYETAGNTITQASALVGTPTYMAPEQVRLEALDHRTDLYALACVAYRALTGKPAFVGDDVAGVLYNVVHLPPPQPSALVRIPLDLELVFAIAMSKSPGDRFQRAEELASAFGRAARGELDHATRERGLKMVSKYPWSMPGGRAT